MFIFHILGFTFSLILLLPLVMFTIIDDKVSAFHGNLVALYPYSWIILFGLIIYFGKKVSDAERIEYPRRNYVGQHYGQRILGD